MRTPFVLPFVFGFLVSWLIDTCEHHGPPELVLEGLDGLQDARSPITLRAELGPLRLRNESARVRASARFAIPDPDHGDLVVPVGMQVQVVWEWEHSRFVVLHDGPIPIGIDCGPVLFLLSNGRLVQNVLWMIYGGPDACDPSGLYVEMPPGLR